MLCCGSQRIMTIWMMISLLSRSDKVFPSMKLTDWVTDLRLRHDSLRSIPNTINGKWIIILLRDAFNSSSRTLSLANVNWTETADKKMIIPPTRNNICSCFCAELIEIFLQQEINRFTFRGCWVGLSGCNVAFIFLWLMLTSELNCW